LLTATVIQCFYLRPLQRQWERNYWKFGGKTASFLNGNDPAPAALSPSSFSQKAKLQKIHGQSTVLLSLQKTFPVPEI